MPTLDRPPDFDELGVVGWFKARSASRRSGPTAARTLRHEGGGRLDRLDLWIVVVLVVGTMVLRTFRLAEPYQMHFDEVYHARTATEFLQDWRYGLSHDIYEWTHPHLAKYAMAVGIVLWGEDHVTATSDLGVPVVAAAVEPRPDRRDRCRELDAAGERLHVATGTEIRTYDLATRELISIIAAPGRRARWPIDETGSQLVIGYDDGRLATLDLDLIGDGGVGRRGRRADRWSPRSTTRSTHLLVVTTTARRSSRPRRPTDLGRPSISDGRASSGRSTSPASPTSRPAAAARRSSRPSTT